MASTLPTGVSIVRRNRRRPDGTKIEVKLYQVRVTWQGRRELMGRFESLQDARNAQLLAQADILRGTFIPPREIRAAKLAELKADRDHRLNAYKVRDLAKDWLDFTRRMGRKESTIYTYERRLEKHILPPLGDLPLNAVTPPVVQEWYDTLEQAQGNGVTRGAYMALTAMFSYATGQAKGLPHDFPAKLDVSPCRVVGGTRHQPVKSTDADDKVIEDRQLELLAAEMPEGERLAVLIAGWMALRIGEVLGLQRRDVTVSQGTSWLSISRQVQSRGQGLQYDTPKSKAGVRSLPVLENIQAALEAQLKEYVGEAPDAPLFPRTAKGAIPVAPNSLRRHFNTAIKAANTKGAGIPEEFVFHGLRHTALTRFGANGATHEELKLWAGQDDDAVVAKYQHATKNRLVALAARVSGVAAE